MRARENSLNPEISALTVASKQSWHLHFSEDAKAEFYEN